MKLLIRLFTASVATLCLIMICCNFMFTEIRESEFNNAITIASHHLIDSYLEQKELLGYRTPEQYKELLESGGMYYESLVFEKYDGGTMTQEFTDTNLNIKVITAKVELKNDYDIDTAPEGVLPINIHQVEVDLEDSFLVEGVYYTEDGYEKPAVLEQQIKENGSGIYTFGTAQPNIPRQVYIKYYKEGYEKKVEEPLFFYTDQDFKDYLEHDIKTQLNTISTLKFNYATSDVLTGIMDVTVESTFKTLGGMTKTLYRTINTTDAIYPSFSYIKDIISNQHNSMEHATRIYKEWLDGLGITYDQIEPNDHFINPIEKAKISAKTWRYPASLGSGVHLGVDFAAVKNTEILAPGNGIILISSNGCPDGNLGNSCSGDDPYAVTYGGNQITMLSELNGEYYAITFSHMSNLWIHDKGLVKQGDLIGYVGTSGNSTGPHTHIEMIYLGSSADGTTSWDTIFNKKYSSSFNAGWGEVGNNKRCDLNPGTVDCRVTALDYLITPEFISFMNPTNNVKSVINLEGIDYYVVSQKGSELKIVPKKNVSGSSYNQNYVRTIDTDKYYFSMSITGSTETENYYYALQKGSSN